MAISENIRGDVDNAINSDWQAARFWHTLVITGVVIIGFVALFNFLVDPFSIYGLGLLPRTEINYCEKKLQLFSDLETAPEVLILGSSRAFAFDPEFVTEITGKTCFNFAAPGAKTETYYSILRLALDDFSAPVDTIILSFDPESFHPTQPIQPEVRYIDELARYFIHHDSGKASFFERLTLLLTLNQFTESMSSIQTFLRGQTGMEKMTFREDGYAVWVQRERDIEAGTFDLESRLERRVRKYPARSFGLPQFTCLSETRLKYWEDFIEICDENNIAVYAFLPPYHPELLDLLDAQGADEIIDQVKSLLDSDSGSRSWVFQDYRNIESFGGDENMFYDEIHIRPGNAELLLRDLFSGYQNE